MDDLIKFLKENSIKFIEFRFVDFIGKTHSITYNADKIDVLNDKETADLETIFCDPFCVQPTAVILCNRESRLVAKNAYNYMLSTKIANAAQCAFEIGFSIFDEIKLKVNSYDSHVSLSTVKNYLNTKKRDYEYDDSNFATDPLSDLRSEIILMMQESGIDNSFYHKKISSFLSSISVGNDNFLKSADSIQKSKFIIRNVAHSYGKTATFMPNLTVNTEGNGLFLYQSLYKGSENLFNKPEDYSYYMGGIMKHIKAINAYSNPTTNSYKRLKNLPSLFLKEKLSFPDPTANTYLCFAAILMAGLDGIQNKIHLDEVEKQASKSLNEALEELDKDRAFLLKGEVFTNKQIDQYIEFKREEIKKIESALNPEEFIHYYNI